MKFKTLPNTDLTVSVVGMGCWPIIGGLTWGNQDLGDARRALRTSLDCGINYFDTAEMYGQGASECLLGEELKSVSNEVVIASKVIPEHAEPARLKKSCEDSLRALKRDWIDVYHVHWPVRDVPVADVVATLKQLKKEGKIREMAVSNFGKLDLQDFLDAGGDAPVNQLPYNLFFRAIEHEILPACQSADSAVICYGPMQQGMLTGKWQSADEMPEGRTRMRLFSGDRPHARHGEAGQETLVFETLDRIRAIAKDADASMQHLALGWLIAHNGVAAVIPGIRNAEQAKAAAACAKPLDSAVLDALTDATEELKDALGPNPDMWESAENSRFR